MQFSPSFLGGIATQTKLKQDLLASQAKPAETSQVIIAWPGHPLDGVRATLHSSVPGQTMVTLANGRAVAVPPTNLVAAPKTEEKKDKKDGGEDTEKNKKVVPTDKPDTRGDAAQAEDLTERAKKSSVENQQPPVLEHMKKGPASIPAENARTAEPADEGLKILIEAVELSEKALLAAKEEAKTATAKVTTAAADEAKKIKAIVDEMEKTGVVVARIADRLVALDSSKNVAAVNIPKTGALRQSYEQALAQVTSISTQLTSAKAALAAVEAESEEKYGATYNVRKRVSLFPASLHAGMSVEGAGFASMVTSMVRWFKGILGLAEDAEKSVDEFAKHLESAEAQPEGEVAPVEASIQAAPDAVAEAPARHPEVVAEFVKDMYEPAVKGLKEQEQLSALAGGETWNEDEAFSALFDFLIEHWHTPKYNRAYDIDANDEGYQGYVEDFDLALGTIFDRAKADGHLFEGMTAPKLEGRLAAWAAAQDPAGLEVEAAGSKPAQEFISGEIEHLVKDKGFKQDRAKGAAYSIARRKGYKASKVAAEKLLVEEDDATLDRTLKGLESDLEKAAGHAGNSASLGSAIAKVKAEIERRKSKAEKKVSASLAVLSGQRFVLKPAGHKGAPAEMGPQWDMVGEEDPDYAHGLTTEEHEEHGPEAAMPVFEERKRKAVEASAPTFASFQAALRARTGLLAAEAGVADEAAFKASVEPRGQDAWIGGFIRANGLVDLKPVKAAKAVKVPKDWAVQPLAPGQEAKDKATCGTCGLSWDDSISTSMTPVPSGRCPFEQFHHDVKAAADGEGDTEFIKHRDGKWVIIDHAGKVLSHHDSREQAVESMRALQFHKHGG